MLISHNMYKDVFNRHATLKLCATKGSSLWMAKSVTGFFPPYLWCSIWNRGKKFWLAENLCSGMLKVWMPELNSMLKPLLKKIYSQMIHVRSLWAFNKALKFLKYFFFLITCLLAPDCASDNLSIKSFSRIWWNLAGQDMCTTCSLVSGLWKVAFYNRVM